MEIKAGDRVRILDESGEGVVARIAEDGTVMVELDGFEFPYPQSKVVPVKTWNDVSGQPVPIKDRMAGPAKKKAKPEQVREIDLHIHKLVSNERGLRHHHKLQMQLSYCREQLEKARNDKLRKLVIIHGVGEGVLKMEVHKILDKYSGLEYHDASYQRYGYGATEVVFW